MKETVYRRGNAKKISPENHPKEKDGNNGSDEITRDAIKPALHQMIKDGHRDLEPKLQNTIPVVRQVQE